MFAAEFVESKSVNLGMFSIEAMLTVSTIAGLLVAARLHQYRNAKERTSVHHVDQTAAAVRISLQALALLLASSFLLRRDLPLCALVLALILMPLALLLEKRILNLVIQGLYNRGYGNDHVVIYGAGEAGRRITFALLSAPCLALQPIAVIDEDVELIVDYTLELASRRCPRIAVACSSISAEILSSLECDLLVIATRELSTEESYRLTTAASHAGVRVAQLREVGLAQTHSKGCIEIDGLILVPEKEKPSAWFYPYGKRVVDLIVSSLLLVLLSPVLLLVALIIRLSSRGPALFVQERVGRDGALFKMYKFRSMCSHAQKYEPSPKTSLDPRITQIGKFLRRTSIDELPQLINVFLGQMSLVGPRPEMPFIVHRYSEHQRQRLQVAPGITGLWQLSSDRAHPIHENLHHDFVYIRDRTLSLDMAILLHTLLFAMRRGI